MERKVSDYLMDYGQSPVFKGFSKDELEEIRLKGYIREGKYKKGDLIFRAGQTVSELGIVLSGSVSIEILDLWGNTNILSHIPAGQVFAETYALCQESLMVDVLVWENSRILFLNVGKMMALEEQENSWYRKFLYNMLQISMGKNLALSNRISCTASKSVRSRVMTYLSAEAVKTGSMEIEIPFNRQQMADYLNVERSALSKELGRMREDGILEFHKNHFSLYTTEEK